MSAVDIWAVLSAFVASGALGLRANMLKPTLASWKTAPDWVWLAVSFGSVALGAAGINILGGGNANAREAASYTAVAIVAVTLLVNLAVNGRNRIYVDESAQPHHL